MTGFGRKIGFPTANIKVIERNKIIPGNGVYAVLTKIDNNIYQSMLNIGNRPTVSSTDKRTIEVNIFDFKENIYEKKIDIYIYSKIRDEIKFPDTEKLKLQLVQDKIMAQQFLPENSSFC